MDTSFKITSLREIESYARQNGSRKSTACEKWTIWAEQWIASGNAELVTSIDNYHHARRVIKSCGKKCTSAIASGNCVTIFYA